MAVEFTELEKTSILQAAFTNVDKPTFAIKGTVAQELKAVLLAYYSRHPNSLRENFWEIVVDKESGIGEVIRQELDQNKNIKSPKKRAEVALSIASERMLKSELARRFHEKYTVGYGHNSVAEHAVVTLCDEGLTFLGAKILEDGRLASYLEKSSRYQQFSRDTIFVPGCFEHAPEIKSAYLGAVNRLFDVYEESAKILKDYVDRESPDATEAAKRNMVFDVARVLLPTGCKTQAGVTINARSLAKTLSKMASSPLEEARLHAKRIKAEALKLLPTLVKHADQNDYYIRTRKTLEKIAGETETHLSERTEDWSETGVRLVHFEEESEAIDKIVASLLFEHFEKSHSYGEVSEYLCWLPIVEKTRIIDKINKGRRRHDQLPRGFELTNYTWEAKIDFGAYRDLQRQRVCTQFRQAITPENGYSIPHILVELGLQEQISDALDDCNLAYRVIRDLFPLEAQYVLPLAANVRVAFTMNLRELDEVAPLRTNSKCHDSYKKVVLEVVEQIRKVHPYLGGLLRTGDVE